MNEIQKTQAIRTYDILFLGPFMIWFGMQAKGMPQLAKMIMIGSGIGTIFYNYYHYAQQSEILSPRSMPSV